MMSQSKFVVGPPPGVDCAAPSLPVEPMEYACAAVVAAQACVAPNSQPLPQPSFAGSCLMYVGERYWLRSAYTTPVNAGKLTPAALYLFTSVARASHAVAIVRMSAMVRFCC